MTLEGKQVDRYHILHLLGSGGMGDVYLAEDPRIGQQVAIKVIRTEVAPYPDENNAKDAARLFHREAKAIVRLDHPHILPLFDYGEERIGNMSIIYLVMPYRPEGSLSDWLRKRETKQLLSPRDIAHFVAQAASALQHAHDHNVIHQDVKPSNFLVRISIDTSPLPDLLLSDFGIARLSSATSSVSQSVRGTPSYMAPEQWEGEPVPSTDQYALAVMAYELLTGKLPFQGGPGKMMYQHIHVQPQPTSALNPGLTGEIDKVVARALAKRPQERFDSVSEFGIAFQQAVGSVSKVQSGSLLNQIEKPGVALTPIASDDAEGNTPTLLNSAMPDVGSDSETFVKIEHSSTSTLKPPRKRKLTVVALIMLVVALIGGGVAYAVSSVTAASSGGHLGLTTLTPNRSPVVTNATSASISIVPATKTLQNPFSIEAVTGGYSPTNR
ncbi:MAG TPA: serine/threonine-protein kinase [Ktedonobacteraceae bacterium]|nr:serine/threonine-protein kinase [Ktedonobacteraceae bacterium]